MGSDWFFNWLIDLFVSVANRDQANIVGDPTAAGADLSQGGMENTGQAVSYHDNGWKNDWSISDWQVNVNKNIQVINILITRHQTWHCHSGSLWKPRLLASWDLQSGGTAPFLNYYNRMRNTTRLSNNMTAASTIITVSKSFSWAQTVVLLPANSLLLDHMVALFNTVQQHRDRREWQLL